MLKQAIKNTIFTSIGTGANLILNILFAGLMVRFLGEGQAGYFLTLQAILGLNAIIGGQIFKAPGIQHLARLNSKNRSSETQKIVGTIATANLTLGIFVSLILLCSFPIIFQFSKLDRSLINHALWATIFTALGYLTDQISSALRLIYDSQQRFDIISVTTILFGLFGNIFKIFILIHSPYMDTAALTNFTISLLWFICDYLLFAKINKIRFKFTWSTRVIKPMLKFGIWSWVGNLSNCICGSIDRIVLTAFLGSASLTYYAIPLRIVNQLHAAIGGQCYFLFPMLSQTADNARSEIARIEDRLRWCVGLFSLFVYGSLAFAGPTILSYMINDTFAEKIRWSLYLTCITYFFAAQSFTYHFSLWAVGDAVPNVITDFVLSILTILTAIFIIPKFGYLGGSIALLWRLPIVVIHNIWARRVLCLNSSINGMTAPYLSTFIAFIIWIGVFKLLSMLCSNFSFVRLLLVIISFLPSLFFVYWVETKYFSKYKRWSTALEALKLIIKKVKMQNKGETTLPDNR